jgi:hypothetical protein
MKWKGWLIMISSLASSHKVGATVITGAATVAVVSPLGQALIPFLCGFAGAVVMHLLREPVTVGRAVGSAVVSVMLGGLAGPAAMDLLVHYEVAPYSPPVLWLVSFVCAASWPAFAPAVGAKAKALIDAMGPKAPAKESDDGRA